MTTTTNTPARPLTDEHMGNMATSVRFFVLPEYKLMYVSLAKNACTALKWMMADLGGEDASQFHLGLSPYTSDIDVIHDRRQWRKVPRLNEVPDDVRAEIHPDNGWLIFSVVRDPRPRCFSAWQNKMLLRAPNYVKWSAEPWYPRFPADQDTIIADFAKFVDMLAADPKHPLLTDTHFRPQTRLLRQDKITYTRIYDLTEMGKLRAEVTAHLERFGWSGELYLPRSNESPLRPIASAFEGGVREQLESIYAADFKRFGSRWDFAAIPDGKWSDEVISDAQRMTTAGARIAELRNIGLEQRRELNRLTKQVAALEARPVGFVAQVRRTLIWARRILLIRVRPIAKAALKRTRS